MFEFNENNKIQTKKNNNDKLIKLNRELYLKNTKPKKQKQQQQQK